MKHENALVIASLLEESLKEETRCYNPNHSMWVGDLIEAMKEFYDDNDFEIDNKLIQDYYETKEWCDEKNSQ